MVIIFGFVVGTILGSFVKAIADRCIDDQTFFGRSYCPSCKKTLRWYDLFPVFSYLVLSGRCRYCRKKIPADNLVVELVMGIVGALVFSSILAPNFYITLGFNLTTVSTLLALLFRLFTAVVLGIIFIVDLKTYIIPDRIMFPATIIAGLYLIFAPLVKAWSFYQDIWLVPIGRYLLPPHSNYFVDNVSRIWMNSVWALLSGAAASAFFALLIIGTRGRGMGWGDVKFVFFMGLVLGFPNILVGLFFAFLFGALVSVVLIASAQKRFGQTIPFGPFLALGTFIALLWGNQILEYYLTLGR